MPEIGDRLADLPIPFAKSKRPGPYRKTWQLYVISAFPILLFLIFNYIPMVGNIIAFEDFSIRKGLFGSPFVGLKYFEQFFNLPVFWNIVWNTVALSFLGIAIGFPMPIILALAFNEIGNPRIKKTLQTITYAPYFISTVVMVSILMQVFSYRYGVVNELIKAVGGKAINFFAIPSYFRSLYVFSNVWQTAGYGSVLYIAALSSIDATLYEAAAIDGASRLRRIIHIDLPGILPTIIITLVLSTGSILSIGFEKVYLMQNPANYSVSEIISTFVYKIGIRQALLSLSTAIGLFNTAVNFCLLMIVNAVAKRVSQIGLF
jgi:putative aldouronate transport system permease protein